ncbi:MAG: PAS domain S-box protein [Nitrospirae bacterium]|nr:PAS domain S-box protein [Nitrospirota bacterium]
MIEHILHKLKTIRLWHLFWISMLLTEILTALTNVITALIIYREIRLSLLITGAVDAFVLSLIVAPVVVFLVKHLRETERALTKKTVYLDNIMRSFTDMALAATDLDFRIVYYNHVAEKIFGYKADAVIGHTVMEMHTREQIDPSRFGKAIETVRKEGEYRYTIKQETENGTRILESRVSGILDEKGKLAGFVLTSNDVTERERAREKLNVRANQQAVVAELGQRALSGIEPSTLMEESVSFVAKTLDVEYCKVLELLPDGNEFLLRAGVGWKDGLTGHTTVGTERDSQAGYTLVSSKPVVVEDLRTESRFRGPQLLTDHDVVSGMSVIIHGGKRPFGILGAHTTGFRKFTTDDIHFLQAVSNVLATAIERSRAEERIAAEKERLAVTLQSIGDGVITTDTDGNIVLINKIAEELTGWSQEDAVKRPLTEIFHIINEKTGEPVENPAMKVLKTRGIVGFADKTVLKARDGTERIISDSAAPICDKEGKIIGVVLVLRDITEKLKLEGEILKTQKLESLGVLAGGIAHDFNNLLTAILGNISIAKTYIKPEDKTFERLTEAEKASLRAKGLTRQLLTFAKGGEVMKKTASVAEIIKDSSCFALRGSNVMCKVSIAEDLRPVEIDKAQFSQVIDNLIINAQQAMPKGGTVEVSAENISAVSEKMLPFQEGDFIKISIKDQGSGIPKKNLQKIFDPYFTTKKKGSGLGLAITYSIIKKHDGYITVESKPGTGTTFHIYLPASLRQSPTEVNSNERVYNGWGKILIMDDEGIVRDVAGQMLRLIGYEVEFTADGSEMLEVYKKARESGEPYDAVIMDLTVPGGMGGKDAISKLVEICPGVKAIVSSGYSNDPIMADYRKYGFCGVVTKPYKLQQLSQVLYEVLFEESD